MSSTASSLRRRKRAVCGLCRNDITTVEIICAECPEPFKFCLECLACGVEVEHAPEHKRTHAYSITENLASHRLFDKDWTAEDEMALIDGLSVCGIGNWFEIASFLGDGRTEKDIERHFERVYIDSDISPLPSASWMQVSGGASGSSNGSTESGSGSGDNAADLNNTTSAGHSASSSKSGRGRGRPSQGGESSSSGRNFGHIAATPGYSSKHVPRTEIVGYLPLRGDFDVEWENDAETVIADLDFAEDEHPVERELKLKLLEIYNAKLDERERRKAFVIERGLLDYKRLISAERRRPKEEKEVYEVLRPFARFLTPSGFEDLIRAVILEQRLRRRIIQLQEYKQKGIATLAEAADYESQRKKGASVPPMPTGSFTPDGLSKMADGLIMEVQGALDGMVPNKRTRDSLLASAVMAEAEKKSATQNSESGKDAPSETTSSTSAATDTKTDTDEAQAPSQELVKKARQHFDPSLLPGANRLTADELALCRHLYLTPRLYEQIKLTLLNISLTRGATNIASAKELLVHVEVQKIAGVLDFVVKMGWVSRSAEEDNVT